MDSIYLPSDLYNLIAADQVAKLYCLTMAVKERKTSFDRRFMHAHLMDSFCSTKARGTAWHS